MKRVLIVFGTRPEAIKMAPVVRAFRGQAEWETKVCVTAQHRAMLDQVLSLFGIEPDFDLNLMSASQTLEGLSARILEAMSTVLHAWRPDLVLVHGDTTTTFMASLACFYNRVPIGHVEAGLRTGNLEAPWPEEMNRRVTGLLARLHFAPTEASRRNLLAEAVPPESIEVTGNTVIDALSQTAGRLRSEPALGLPLRERFSFLRPDRKLLLVTGHRRENFGEGMREICDALLRLSRRQDLEIVYAVHLNPNVKGPVEAALDGVPNIHLIPPQDYLSFVYLMMECHLLLTDSGGIQEEAPTLGKPVLVMREATERPEAVDAGTARLVGARADPIVRAVDELMDTPGAYEAMANRANPYGDGHAADRIVARSRTFLAGSR
ncbi:UDP-N-acetylglucosamine 2-epimerase (non-hydrolyzing) [Ramlibacter monticola]|uniref:Probable UDP-N-acetylglucosamine 2-epimerase n=1 Tax=Ramlibacter monticola TaxID=1926872 RepID=A0A936Z4T8_9BURK|nr:UDP-N-acetylglucosamine 2-epimerase (non-hydrolyzing) [Ramlibacter monticola]MBL0395034.1 UDP-N-acetylglucosamine 2-epimerase (non-hydrolyzing) [Ramlibacter monticola]